jgi:hypothetical protein
MLKIGTLIYDNIDKEWGLIINLEDYEEYDGEAYKTAWSKSVEQVLFICDLEQDRFEIYETV